MVFNEKAYCVLEKSFGGHQLRDKNDTLVLDKQSCPQKMKTGVIKQENSEMFSTFWLAISSLSR